MAKTKENLQTEKKNNLFKQLISKAVREQRLHPDFKKLMNESVFLDKYREIFQNLIDKFKNDEIVTESFIVEHFGIVPQNVEKTQLEIVEQIDEIFFSEKFNDGIKTYQEESSTGFKFAYKKLVDSMNHIRTKLEKIFSLSLWDEDALESIYNKMTDGSNLIQFGMEGFDELRPERGQLVGFLGGTGSGKSIVLQRLNAMAIKKNYKCVHFTLELNEVLFLKRLISALGWYSFKMMEFMTWEQFKQIIKRFKRHAKQTIVSVEKGRVNLAKIEKVILQEKPDIVFIDYIQLINEDFDPMSSKASVSQLLNELAIRYNCLIVVAIQTNDAGRGEETGSKYDEKKKDEPPFLTHIKKMKGLADDMTFVVAVKMKKCEYDFKLSIMDFVTRKHRNDFWTTFQYKNNLNTGDWELQNCESKQAPIDPKEADELFESFLKEEFEQYEDLQIA